MKSCLLVVGALAAALGAAHGGSAARVDLEALREPLYQVEGDAFVRHNGDRFNNRPLYCNQISAIVVAGDRPLVRFGTGSVLNGTFMAALVRGDKAKWLHDFSDNTSKYRPDRMEWILQDPGFGKTLLILRAVPPAAGAGVELQLQIENAQPGDRLVWVCGGAVQQAKTMVDIWDVTTGGRQKTLTRGFAPDECRTNRVTLAGERFIVQASGGRAASAAVGQCSAPSTLTVADAAAWKDPLKLLASSGKELPLACGVTALDEQRSIFWTIHSFKSGRPLQVPDLPKPTDAFVAGLHRAEEIGNRIVVQTPDAQLNAQVAASCAVMDGVFREGIFTHSGMRWGVPLLGWRTMFGGTAYGWHERVLAQARTCLAKQITESDKTVAKADEKTGLSCQSLDSRLFGKGRINLHHPWHYDMQSQFFDQLIHAWRWTGDPELEKILRPALELHLEYIHDCFDPDDDGLYESYANTWPTDDQWYNGGGTAEETAYAYTGHKAALELARRAGDAAAVKRHEARLAKIKKSFMEKLWIPSKGYVGSWLEQGGHGRLHEDSWLYAIFCPIDAGMLPTDLAAESLYYTEWGLEREKMPYGGERVWPSNWVPSLWSLREMWPGDDYHLALAYFQTGLADDGWKVLRGTFPLMAFYGPVPGDLGYPCGGTDFNDCASMFCRTVVEGLFGYRPDYPNGLVTIAPQLPSDWEHAAIKTPDVALDFVRTKVSVSLTKPAALELRLPVRAKKLVAVTVNGAPAKWEVLPGYGCSIAKISVPQTASATVELTCEEPLPHFAAIPLEIKRGDALKLPLPDAQLVGQSPIPSSSRYQLLDALVQTGKTQQRRLFKVTMNDPAGEAAEAARVFEKVPADAKWDCLDVSPQFNGDIRTIFQQKYLSPRPTTCSLRLATDGCSTWQQMLDPKHKAPAIDLTGVPKLLDAAQRLCTTQGVPFAFAKNGKNIAFTSLWDNWPRQVTVPVNKKAEGLWLLVCGFTPPMQGRIANAELRLKYADGVVEKIELVPPFNFWSLCPFGRVDYNYARDGFALPKTPPQTVQLGNNCRAIMLNQRLRPGVALESVTLETLSQEVIIGLLGATLLNPS